MLTYLLFDGKYYKIGQSKDPQKRASALLGANVKIKLLAYGDGITEKILHEKYKNKRVKREWFKLSKKDVEDIIRKIHFGYIYEEDKTFEKRSKYVMGFGKYAGTCITDMNSKAELTYLRWCLMNLKELNINTRKVFRWWLNQHKIPLKNKKKARNIKFRKR